MPDGVKMRRIASISKGASHLPDPRNGVFIMRVEVG
jgi:hypothetical protein